MTETNYKQGWEKYREHEITAILPLLKNAGFILDRQQPLIAGEKYLMQAVTTASGKKLVLLGRDKNNNQVVIKTTSDPQGIAEIKHEKKCRAALQKIGFAYQTFFYPQETLFTKIGKTIVSVQEFIESEQSFLNRPLKEQFFLSLKAFKNQESAHATAYKHRKFIKKTFGEKKTDDYIKNFNMFKTYILEKLPEKKQIRNLLKKTEQFLQANTKTIEQYCGFLAHTDFVPHNFRITGDKIYLLDHSSIRFGNKYEGWARFLNFMALYNPELEKMLVEYVRINRTEEESLSLQLMRVYRLAEIIYYYANTLSKTSGNLLALNRTRIDFWGNILQSVLENKKINENIIEEYKKTRDSLRDEEEMERQKILY